jgi:hypothetical protein
MNAGVSCRDPFPVKAIAARNIRFVLDMTNSREKVPAYRRVPFSYDTFILVTDSVLMAEHILSSTKARSENSQLLALIHTTL